MRKGTPRGKSHSKRPVTLEVPEWVKMTPEEVEKIIVNLAKKGYTKPMIGQILRDQYGIPLVKGFLGKKLTEILVGNNVQSQIPDDLQALLQHASRTIAHLEQHPKDMFSLRGLEITESKILRLSKYYRRQGVLPQDWKYKPRAASFT
ncbi:30S ribosomal protein S15 [Candidatus Marsarchaeota G2 archaeon OSP_D]|jgi:Ribosomal protein S15P/S13E|uniref:Small ribosomal subunit protein uS15 n=4 Tax=Candidatus Marsarchaeota group 2 TaxID=2203771 RepID=A0A2R6CBQ6_9ARCH|nr:MAG: 30S ribosomal protein S15 [Candidatus Marsarchaeota G2 archaeon ECH_B_SAG-M15]PSN92669.1 MAG: 30S ribosomal protein S15 [Candidatus Marsarchaeota G2 archaeon OSP_D]PSN97450.1 MAG: 30S ribosomal protein S15 [Candidatus Marsarchaeota G2 archaeon ECH_B_SAG-C16]PSO08281.1 MAG: 30S ribosomal protein S15 [Candidatus Marsarchaeota G2 archaeon BE_D]